MLIKSRLQKFSVKADDFLVAARLNDEITVFNFLEPYFSARYLQYLEFHLADHCNLNCHACGHCSSLVMEPVFPVFEKIVQDFRQLKKFIDDIGWLRFVGGEPLLNPEINKYVKFCRKIYPNSKLEILTNGTLILQMPEEFFDTLKENNVSIEISVYPPMKSKIPEIQNLLQQKGIELRLLPRDKFVRMVQIHPHNHAWEKFLTCNSNICTLLFDGKLSLCSDALGFKYFNKYFNQNLPTDGYIDLYDKSLTIEKLKKFFLKPTKECAHCGNAYFFDWRPLKHPVKLSDWVIDVPEEQ